MSKPFGNKMFYKMDYFYILEFNWWFIVILKYL